ncbi:allophanate hydrolase [Ideonella livida]|uniref:Allophanate hydrolase n=1 Tax=Ideonella livida TaxID=2707176 RepID=A0A7C9PL09_9BURK|nr:allophanate hydrolase [Ideonella livida]NDY93954.1 allophanate hydrolase [Ideonella livida]
MSPDRTPLDLATLHAGYTTGRFTPLDVIEQVIAATAEDPHHAWIHRRPAEALRADARALMDRPDAATLPLYGVPFAIKDNIDLAGVPTTAGCPAYAYTPERSAFVVQRLIDAGAIPVGKTNLDQFATGLNGTRSPYGACRNALDPALVSGGSSSGSSVSVALGQVSFSLGTDTAGSGRVPAAFNQLVGTKPTCGLLSASGVVPACRTLDTISLFTLTAEDAAQVLAVAQGLDEADAYSVAPQPHGWDFGRADPAQVRLGVPLPAQRRFTDPAWAAGFEAAVAQAQALGVTLVALDFEPLLEVARLLYEGPWVAERYQAIRPFIDSQPEAVFPVTRQITLGGATPLAADAFAAQYRLKALQRRCDALWHQVDLVLAPTAPGHPSIQAMLAEPVARNSELGWYTNFMNLLGYAAVAVPAARVDGSLGAGANPFGVTFFAPAHQDVPLLRWAARWQHALRASADPAAGNAAALATTLGATGWPHPAARQVPPQPEPTFPAGWVEVAVCGAHLSGQPLNPQLTHRGAKLVASTTTAPDYRLIALADGKRPGLIRVAPGQGHAIEVEVWSLPATQFGSFVAGIPAPLGIGRTRLADGREVCGFIAEPVAEEGATEISGFGGWRAWRASLG